MKKHILGHYVKRAYLKCEDCEFFGENVYRMEVPMGKHQSDSYVGGLCEYKSDNLENLEMHM